MSGPHGRDEEGPRPAVWLVIPYFTDDRGRPGIERPLAAASPSWLCPSIHKDGIQGQFTPGEPFSVRVTVGNRGAGAIVTPVTVSLWWAIPTTVFQRTTWLGQCVVPVPSGAERTSPPITGSIPADAGAHVCLLARVTSPLDLAAGPVDPVGDRHWAQLNLSRVVPAPDGSFTFGFNAANPGSAAVRHRLVVVPPPAETREALSSRFNAPVVPCDAWLQLSDGGRDAGDDARHELSLHLAPAQERSLVLRGRTPGWVQPGALMSIAIVQMDEAGRPVGSVGLVVG